MCKFKNLGNKRTIRNYIRVEIDGTINLRFLLPLQKFYSVNFYLVNMLFPFRSSFTLR